jgi:hypothetical protein
VGIVAGKQKFPFKVGAGLIDRETGEIRYFVDGAEDSVSSMVIGPDGGLYVGNSPLRRVLGRATFGKELSPKSVVGGVTRFKPVRYDLFLRDALQATANRATNAASIVDIDSGAVAADIFHIGQLLDQCRHLGPSGLAEGSLDADRWSRIERALDEAQVTMTADARALGETASILNEALKELL